MMWGSVGFFAGMVLGSLVKALADRSLFGKSFWGRSYCPKCQHTLAWYDLLPIFSYILLRGKCRYCHKKFGREYLVVEVVMGILIGFLFWQNPVFIAGKFTLSVVEGWQSVFQSSILLLELLFKIFFITVLAILFLTDLKKMFIPDRIVLPAIVIGVVYLLVMTLIKIGYLYYYLTLTPIGQKLLPPYTDYFQRHALQTAQPLFGAVLMGILLGAFFLGLIIITRGKGMGGGDVKLGAFIGIMLGFPQAVFAIVLSFLIGAVFSIMLIITGKKNFGQTIPFGPFLVLGSLIMLFWGETIVKWYLHIGR